MADQGRVDLAARDTPLQPADRLGAALGFAPGALWVKRDDLTGLAGGGNKARKLEVLVAAALAEGADTLVTGGAGQSNHVRMTAAAAARFGLACSAVLLGSPPAAAEGNLVLDALLGAELSWAAWDTAAGALDAACARAVTAGRRTYLIPLGGSSPLGASGYAACADELIAAAPPDALVVVADGSGGTHAGLAAGFGDHRRVLGVDVGFGAGLAEQVAALAEAAAALTGRPAPSGEVQLDPGLPEPYGAPAAEVREALELAARTEGLVFDPVYTGRALAALIARRRDGRVPADQPVVFLHTGGLPALFTGRYRDWFAV